ncbi:unnamed protein product [Allacma fusca]|uniref:Uncharacterized protein n=1 Tax=Allacma fusca TaxID=39272 RepID=A0A8J2KMY2_9HEXA|nr:unnamed protein product [Allacma fusca]
MYGKDWVLGKSKISSTLLHDDSTARNCPVARDKHTQVYDISRAGAYGNDGEKWRLASEQSPGTRPAPDRDACEEIAGEISNNLLNTVGSSVREKVKLEGVDLICWQVLKSGSLEGLTCARAIIILGRIGNPTSEEFMGGRSLVADAEARVFLTFMISTRLRPQTLHDRAHGLRLQVERFTVATHKLLLLPAHKFPKPHLPLSPGLQLTALVY